jgi:hypothetical protein
MHQLLVRSRREMLGSTKNIIRTIVVIEGKRTID